MKSFVFAVAFLMISSATLIAENVSHPIARSGGSDSIRTHTLSKESSSCEKNKSSVRQSKELLVPLARTGSGATLFHRFAR
jgi:hypothetical protein